MIRYIIKDTIKGITNDNPANEKTFKAQYFFYNGKWRQDTIWLDQKDLYNLPTTKKFNYECYKLGTQKVKDKYNKPEVTL